MGGINYQKWGFRIIALPSLVNLSSVWLGYHVFPDGQLDMANRGQFLTKSARRITQNAG